MEIQNSEPIKSQYFATWKAIFRAVLGWISQETTMWVNRQHWAAFLDNPEDMFYHADPIYWAATTLIPDNVKGKLNNLKRIQLEQEILKAFWDEYHTYYIDSDTDLHPFVLRLEHLFAIYE